MCTSAQPDLDRAAPRGGNSVVLIRGWLCSLPINILTCLVSVTYSLCSSAALLCVHPAALERDSSRTSIQTGVVKSFGRDIVENIAL